MIRVQKIFIIAFVLLSATLPLASHAYVPTWSTDLSGIPGTVSPGWWSSKENQINSFSLSGLLDSAKSSFIPSMDSIVRALAQQATRQLTHSVAEWIRTGEFDTGPLFITNLEDSLAFAADEVTGIFIDELDDDTKSLLCSPFRSQVRQYIRGRSDRDFGRMSFHSQFACTASDIFRNVERMRDFKNVGWAGWRTMIQPQNTFYGALYGAEAEYNNRILSTQESQKTQYLAGGGSLGQRECIERTSTGRCARYRTVTPGSIALGALGEQLGTDAASLIQADEANELVNALIDRALQEAGISPTLLGEIQQGLLLGERVINTYSSPSSDGALPAGSGLDIGGGYDNINTNSPRTNTPSPSIGDAYQGPSNSNTNGTFNTDLNPNLNVR